MMEEKTFAQVFISVFDVHALSFHRRLLPLCNRHFSGAPFHHSPPRSWKIHFIRFTCNSRCFSMVSAITSHVTLWVRARASISRLIKSEAPTAPTTAAKSTTMMMKMMIGIWNQMNIFQLCIPSRKLMCLWARRASAFLMSVHVLFVCLRACLYGGW